MSMIRLQSLAAVALSATLLTGCQSQSPSHDHAMHGHDHSKMAKTSPIHGDVPDARPSNDTLAIAHGEARWDEWVQLPLALQFNERQQRGWDKLTEQWNQTIAELGDKKEDLGDDYGQKREQARADLLANLSPQQKVYWTRFVLYRDALFPHRKDMPSDAALEKLWTATERPARRIVNADMLQTNPYLKGENIRDLVLRLRENLPAKES